MYSAKLSAIMLLSVLHPSIVEADTSTKHIRDPEPPVYKTITINGDFVCEIGGRKTDCTAQEYAEFYEQHSLQMPGKFKNEEQVKK